MCKGAPSNEPSVCKLKGRNSWRCSEGVGGMGQVVEGKGT